MAGGVAGFLTRSPWRLAPLLAAGALAAACSGSDLPPRSGAAPSCADGGAAAAARRLGERMKEVSLLAPDSLVAAEIREAYAPLVTPGLLALWVSDPRSAPGREVSSPWPERIDVLSVEPAGEGACRVEGEVVLVTSAEAAGEGGAARSPVTLRVVEEEDGWRVSAFEAGAPLTTPAPPGSPGLPAGSAPAGPAAAEGAVEEAAEVLRLYYAAIGERDFRRAHALWAGEGAASGQSLEEFAAGFSRTARTAVEIGEPGRVEGAAGSRFVEIPVVVRAEAADGEAQRFEGTYTLRRSVVDGATEEQRLWRIHAADLRPAGGGA